MRDEYGINSCEIAPFGWWWRKITDIAISDVCNYKCVMEKLQKKLYLLLETKVMMNLNKHSWSVTRIFKSSKIGGFRKRND